VAVVPVVEKEQVAVEQVDIENLEEHLLDVILYLH
jgi:hypothetical protein|tara:strand:+ start:80 stop:184 length:105 start_codon:yes stop_codon:yes gene_type:complete